MNPDDYRQDGFGGGWGCEYVRPDCTGYTVISVLPVLTGLPWDEVSLGLVNALRPSKIRVIGPNIGTKLDARSWRVTVYLNEDNRTIREIRQEVVVGLPAGIENGIELEVEIAKRLDAAKP